jgi:hypothetical protein
MHFVVLDYESDDCSGGGCPVRISHRQYRLSFQALHKVIHMADFRLTDEKNVARFYLVGMPVLLHYQRTALDGLIRFNSAGEVASFVAAREVQTSTRDGITSSNALQAVETRAFFSPEEGGKPVAIQVCRHFK